MKSVCIGAAYCGNFEMLQWTMEQKYILPEFTCFAAALKGRFDIVKWLIEQKYQWAFNEVIANVALHGDLDMIKWIIGQVDIGKV